MSLRGKARRVYGGVYLREGDSVARANIVCMSAAKMQQRSLQSATANITRRASSVADECAARGMHLSAIGRSEPRRCLPAAIPLQLVPSTARPSKSVPSARASARGFPLAARKPKSPGSGVERLSKHELFAPKCTPNRARIVARDRDFLGLNEIIDCSFTW